MHTRSTRFLLVLALALLLAGCGPEDGRARGGGPGADARNVPAAGVVPKSKVFGQGAP